MVSDNSGGVIANDAIIRLVNYGVKEIFSSVRLWSRNIAINSTTIY